jgi:S1-C subfamily serine protease
MPADDDDASSGPPPHPLDRVWFHPSELGRTGGTLAPPDPRPRLWLVAALALLVGVGGTLGVVAATRGLTDPAPTPAPFSELATGPGADPDAVADLVAGVGRSVVTVGVAPPTGGAVLGSGVAIRAGRVLTAAHLVPVDGTPLTVTVGGQVVSARLRGVDPETDLALLEVDGAPLQPARQGTGDGLRVGQQVAAVSAGTPTDRWVTVGVLSGRDRLGALPSGVRGSGLLETDARFDRSAAGGALLDATGAVIGILAGPDRHAVPIDVARSVAAQLDLNGRAAHGWLGLLGTDVLDRDGGGVRIDTLIEAGPAQLAGLRPDDVVIRVGSVGVGSVAELVATARRLRPGDPAEVTVVRSGERVVVTVPLGESIPAPADWLVVA